MKIDSVRGLLDLLFIRFNGLIDISLLEEGRSKESIEVWKIRVKGQGLLKLLHSIFISAQFVVAVSQIHVERSPLIGFRESKMQTNPDYQQREKELSFHVETPPLIAKPQDSNTRSSSRSTAEPVSKNPFDDSALSQ